ncbi:MAG: MATE family efflux transporter [Planctomycetota bacterium]|jgi:MATE family multidrug resistance protein
MLPPRRPWLEEIRRQLRLAVPVTVVQLGQMAMGVVDVVMVGHFEARDLAALAIGHAWGFAAMAFALGLLLGLDPLVSHALGAEDEPAVARNVQRGLVLALLVSVPTAGLMALAAPVMRLVGVNSELVPLAEQYVMTLLPSLPAYYGFMVLRTPLQAMGRMRPVVLATLLGNVLNVALNWALIYGHLGAPPLGAVGCGWATTACRWLMIAALLVLAWPLLAPSFGRVGGTLALRPVLRIIRIGAPIGGQVALEIGGFATVALLMGRLGTTQAGAHQVAINLASLSFMFPFAISIAASVRVGLEVGAGRSDGARRAARVALIGTVAIMTFFALVFLVAPGPLARLYSDDAEVTALAAGLIRLAAAFQIFDGLQIVGTGVLRGAGETRAPMIVHLVGFWFLGIPLGAALAFATPLGPRGLWVGLIAGLGAVALVLLLVVRARMSGPLQRVWADA